MAKKSVRNPMIDLDAFDHERGHLNVIIETPYAINLLNLKASSVIVLLLKNT